MKSQVQKKQLLVFIVLAGQIFLSIAGGLVFASTPREKTVFPGVSVNGQNIGGLTGRQAQEFLGRSLHSKLKYGYIELHYDRKKWIIPYTTMGINYDIQATVDEILQSEGKGLPILRSLDMIKTRFSGKDFPVRYRIEEEKMDRVLVQLSSEINIPTENAKICIYYGHIKILPGVIGRTLNVNSVREKIKTSLGKLDNSPINLDVEGHFPDITSDHLKEIKNSIGLGITNYSGMDKAMYNELKLAVEKLNGVVIKPGSEFSFNRAVGLALKETNYRVPQVVMQDGHPAVVSGGAASQAASTLYQAVLYSGLKVIERSPHVILPGYTSPGQDAAVALEKIDLKFENNYQYPVYIYAEIEGNRVIVNLLGVKKAGQTIQVIGKKEEGNQHKPGSIRVKVYRVYYRNGVEAIREMISDNKYQIPVK